MNTTQPAPSSDQSDQAEQPKPADQAERPDQADLPASAAQQPAAPTAQVSQSARALLKQLQETFEAFRACQPLAIGIDKQVIARLPEVNRKALRIALGIHTNSLRYLRQMAKAKSRHDLDGNATAEVTDAHREHAAAMLEERLKKDAERRKAQRKAEAAEREAAEAERRRTEKLAQLAEKFSRNR